MFQSTRPRGARPSTSRSRHAASWFQSTRPRGARRVIPHSALRMWTGFNPRARVGRDRESYRICQFYEWFQSTRPRGARRVSAGVGFVHSFNPRARVGRDPNERPMYRDGLFQSTRPSRASSRTVPVSIHAPAWGATRVGLYTRERLFQSTRPRGARPRELGGLIELFQSTRPRGALQDRSDPCLARQVSIHAPAWGATVPRVCGSAANEFQSTRPRGARLTRLSGNGGALVAFQSTRPRGARRRSRRAEYVTSVSIHAPAGARPTRRQRTG